MAYTLADPSLEENPMTRQQRLEIDAIARRPHESNPQSLDEVRADFAAMMATMRIPAQVRTSPTTAGAQPALLVEPTGPSRVGTILYFHGGSWVVGSPETALSLTANLVVRSGVRAISVDYRLAPEHPFPAGVEDGLAAYRALLDEGIEPTSIVFAGDSAGGGLCITTCLMARSAGLPMPAAVVAFSPGLDATRTGASMDTKAGFDPYFTRENMAPTSALYLAGADPRQELLTPATLADLTGFPPLLLQVGANEVLLDDSTRLAARARDAGVDVILDITADVPHVFQGFAGILDEADQALDRAALFLTQHLA